MICQRCGTNDEGSTPSCSACGAMLASPRLVGIQMNDVPALQRGTSQLLSRSLSLEAGVGGQAARDEQRREDPWAGPPIVQTSRSTLSARRAAASAQPLALRKGRRRWPWYLLLLLAVLGLAVSASWLLLVRPIVHQAVDEQIRHGLQRAVEDIPPLAFAAPAGVPFPLTAQSLNIYIAQHTDQLTPITQMHVSLQSEVMVITFQTYGFGSTIRLGLSVVAGQLVAQHVEVSGLLWWVESSSELTPRLNQALSQISGKLRRALASIQITDGVIQMLFA